MTESTIAMNALSSSRGSHRLNWTLARLLDDDYASLNLRRAVRKASIFREFTLAQVICTPHGVDDFLSKCRFLPQCGDVQIELLRGVFDREIGMALGSGSIQVSVDGGFLFPEAPKEIYTGMGNRLSAANGATDGAPIASPVRQVSAERRVEMFNRLETENVLSAGLVHDLNNLLGMVRNLSDLEIRLNTSESERFATIQELTLKMIQLLAPVRELGVSRARVEQVDLGSIMSEVANLLRLSSPDQYTIQTELPATSIRSILEPIRLTQVLFNLGLNARDALELRGGEISFALKEGLRPPHGVRLASGVIPEAPFAVFSVSDTGPGIPRRDIARVWEPYFTTKGNRGTGLGLPLVATIVREAGGGVAVTSVRGKGTTFFVFWPIRSTDDTFHRRQDAAY